VRRLIVEADGGSRGNPGPAGYGALVRDADTGRVLAERAASVGRTTNNVAEYGGLVAGLQAALDLDPSAAVEVRMDSKLVVEQMSGRWKIKHPDMRPLAMQASRLAPPGTTYTWIPREQNKHADRILNEALDRPEENPGALSTSSTARETAAPRETAERAERPRRGWSPDQPTTTLVLVRHGVTSHTVDKRFSSGLGGSNPGLTDEGRAQMRATADWLAPLADGIDVVVSSPVRRTHESAEIVGARLEKPVLIDDGLAEMEFGTWDGLTFAEIQERHPDELDRWLGSLDEAPGGGESFRVVEKRVLGSLERLLSEYAGQTVLAVSHVTPIKVLVAHALSAPLDAVYRMELAPASVTVLSFFPEPATGSGLGGHASLRMFNARPTDAAFTGR
jgi:probable phosphoglycerate mutase